MVSPPWAPDCVLEASGLRVGKSAGCCKKVAKSFGGLKKNAYLRPRKGQILPGEL